MRNLIGRAVCLAVLLAASSLSADSYHPNIPKSQVVTLDAAAIERYANSGTPFELDLGETQVNVVVSPDPIFPEEGVTIIEVAEDGSEKETVVQGNFTYAGDVIGEDPETTDVRLTIAEGVLEGFVLSSTDWWFIEPLTRFDPKAGTDQYLVYAARETDVATGFGEDTIKGDELVDHPFIKDGKISIAMVADREMLQRAGSYLQLVSRHASIGSALSGIYGPQFGRRFRVRRILIDMGQRLVSTNRHLLLAQLRNFVDDDRLARLGCHLAHLTTGKSLDGGFFGMAEQRGYRSLSLQSVSFTFRNFMLAAHEVGHNFDAAHEYADHWVVFGQHRQTLDADPFIETTEPEFSAGLRNPNHNNRARMCITLANRGFFCQP